MSVYFVTITNLEGWLNHAQRSVFSKNKVRKDLWQDFTDVVRFVGNGDRELVRIPRSVFVSLQTFCMIDGKGIDHLSNDQILNFCTTLDSLRVLLSDQKLVYELATTRLTTTEEVKEEVEDVPEQAHAPDP